MDTTTKGNAFRDSVRTLFEANPRYLNVKSEYRIAHQDVDIYYEEQISTGTISVACECKDYARALTRNDLEAIYAKYDSLRNGKGERVDAVRVIGRLPLGAKAQDFLKQVGFSYATLHDVEASTIDFRSYLRELESAYKNDGLNELYVRAQLSDGSDAEDFINAWITGTSHQPVALLAGYGMGKTSFALHLAATAIAAYRRDPRERIPILIYLSEIASEQSIDGLLGRIFASQHRVPGYHFGLFRELNKRGRFLIILDGFDEMKHAMSWSDFKFNFGQLNSLVVPNSRIVLLGRPSAFLSEGEENFVLRGVEKRSRHTLQVEHAPEYRVQSLLPFPEERAVAFIESYVAYRLRHITEVSAAVPIATDIRVRLDSVRRTRELLSLAQRPVQARMIAELALDQRVQWRAFSRYELYEIFITRLIDREVDKPSRRLIGFADRLRFHEELAWWLWKKSGAVSFRLEQVPQHMFSGAAPFEPEDRDGYVRELLTGSVIERKAGSDFFYFPHRSFVEFLLARRICTGEFSANQFPEIAEVLTSDVVEFVREGDSVVDRLVHWARDINNTATPLSLTFLRLVAWGLHQSDENLDDYIDESASPRDMLVFCFRWLERAGTDGAKLSSLVNRLQRSSVIVLQDETCVAGILALTLVAERSGEAIHALAWRAIASVIRSRASSDSLGDATRRGFIALHVAVILSSRDKDTMGSSSETRIDCRAIYTACQQILAPKWWPTDTTPPQAVLISLG